MRRRPAVVASTLPRDARRRTHKTRLGDFLRAGAANGRLPAFLLSVGLSVFVFGILFSSDFTVDTVVVEGNKATYADSIVAQSQVLGAQIFRLDTTDVARRVTAHPAVASADVSARFPGKVTIRLTERVPALVWQVGDRAVLVDEFGWVIAEGNDPALTRIFQRQGNLPPPGTRISAETIQAARFLFERLGPSLASLEFEETNGLSAILNDGRSVVIGEAERVPLKLSVLNAALGLANHWTRLDVREPDRPYYQ